MRHVRRVIAIWTTIIGCGLILIGIILLASPQISYTTREKIPHTKYSVKGDKVLEVPPAAAVLVIIAGVGVLVVTVRATKV
jgi:hypothetical protein